MTPWPFHTFPVNLRRLGMNLNYRKGTPAKPWISSIEAWKVWVYHGRKYMGNWLYSLLTVNLDVQYLILRLHPSFVLGVFFFIHFLHGKTQKKQSMKRSMKRSMPHFSRSRSLANWIAGGELPDSSMESGWNLWRNPWRVKPHGRLGCVFNPSNKSRYWKCSANTNIECYKYR